MNWFIENMTPANIGILLGLACIASVCLMWVNHQLKLGDEEWSKGNRPMSELEQRLNREAETFLMFGDTGADPRVFLGMSNKTEITDCHVGTQAERDLAPSHTAPNPMGDERFTIIERRWVTGYAGRRVEVVQVHENQPIGLPTL
jgi:hypothetical protein